MTPIRVLLVDDSADFLNSAESFLSLHPAVEVIGCALSGRDALEKIPRLAPDLVLMDWLMPEMNGLEVTRQIKARPDAPRVVILTMYDAPKYRAAARAVGTDGFISKADFGTLLLPVIRALFPSRIA
jgi:DNA-binding NarL/FixJ family response regulator